MRDVRVLLREGFGLHRFPKRVSRNLLKAAEASLVLAERRGVWHRCRHFSFIFDGPRLVSVGLNSRKTHPSNLLYSYAGRDGSSSSWSVGTHSEMNAVVKADTRHFRGMAIVNTRVNRRGELDYSRPCAGCMDMINKMGFGEVYYTTREGEFFGTRL
jgi:deoxycytidylate deaminase